MRTILDVSNIVYGGYYGSPNYRISGFPVGGIRKLFGIINADVRQSDMIVCMDGGNTIKKELLPRYKAGRVPNYSVLAQLDLVKEILTACDIPFYCDDQYEADDFICSAVHFLTMAKDPDDILIYSDDRDISCCVSDNIKVQNVTTNGITIDRNNYERRVVSGEQVPFNTILLYKMVFGDKSDNYLGLDIPGLRFDEFAQFYLDSISPYLASGQFPESVYMDVAVMEAVIDMLPDSFDSTAKEKMKAQAKIVFPQLIDITFNGVNEFYQGLATTRDPMYLYEREHIKTFGMGTFNKRKFDMYCSVLNLNRCRPEVFSASMIDEAEAFKETLRQKAKDLDSGVMAVEHYQKRKTVHPSGSELQNMELPL